MGVAIPVFADLPQHTETVIFGEGQPDAVEVRITLTFRTRTNSWYIDLRTTDGVDIVLGRRVTPQWLPLAGLALEGLPRDLQMIVSGPDDAARADLGVPSDDSKRLFILLVPRSELPPAVVPDLGITATLVV